MKLYHYQVFMPKLKLPVGTMELIYGRHALTSAKNDRYGLIRLPNFLDLTQAKVIEVETDDNKNVVKVVYRTKLDNTRDLCIVVLVDTCFVKTVWINKANDQHRTLDTQRYNKR